MWDLTLKRLWHIYNKFSYKFLLCVHIQQLENIKFKRNRRNEKNKKRNWLACVLKSKLYKKLTDLRYYGVNFKIYIEDF